MSETYLVTAKTVEEAIAIANREYADETHEVSYEIIDMPKKGFLGIGAKDAKIKITVSKIESADLGSIVSELRDMKVLTNRGGDAQKSPEKAPAQKNQQKPQQNQKKDSKPQQNQQKADKSDKPAQQSQPKQKPQQSQPKPQPKTEKQPSSVKEVKEVKEVKDVKEVKEVKEAKEQLHKESTPAAEEKSAPVKAASQATVKTEAAPAAKFGDAGAEYKTSLHNDVKTGKRRNQLPKQSAQKSSSDEDQSAAVTVSAPVGLTDFVSENKTFSSSDDGISYTRMSNDIKKKKNQAPAPKNVGENAQPSVKEVKVLKEAPAASEAAEASDNNSENASVSDRPKKHRRRGHGKGKANKLPTPLTKEEIVEMMKKYDFAETDEDAARLEALLESEIDEIPDDIREKLKLIEEKHAPASAEEKKSESQPKPEEKKREAVSEEEMVCALEFANTLLVNMGLEAKAVRGEPEEGEEFITKEGAEVYPKINIIGDDTGILIGHHGETLDSIQYLVNLSALRRTKQKDGDYVKIVVDIENYREKREETLRSLARRMASRAVKYKRNVYLEPMNAYERRIIHSELQSFDGVSTHSVGADRDRKIVITYEGADRQPDHPRKKKGEGAGTSSSSASASANVEKKSDRRPRKAQKMPIEALPELLESREESAVSVVSAADAASDAASESEE